MPSANELPLQVAALAASALLGKKQNYGGTGGGDETMVWCSCGMARWMWRWGLDAWGRIVAVLTFVVTGPSTPSSTSPR
jgi:hypothetical protein